MARDLALILEGGCAQCAYSYGAMRALDEIFNDQYGLDNFNYIAGSAISALNILYTLSEKFHSDLETIWTDRFSQRRVLDSRSLKRLFFGPSAYDLDYFIDKDLRKNHPLNWSKILKTGCKFYIPLIEVKTLKLAFYTNDTQVSSALLPYELIFLDTTNPSEIYSVLKASMASNILYNSEVEVQKKRYISGNLFAPIPLTAPIPSDAKRIFILTKHKRSKPNWFISNFLPSIARAGLIHGSISNDLAYNLSPGGLLNYQTLLNQIDTFEDDLIIRPEEPLAYFENSPEVMKYNIELGYRDAMNKKGEIQKLIQKN